MAEAADNVTLREDRKVLNPIHLSLALRELLDVAAKMSSDNVA